MVLVSAALRVKHHRVSQKVFLSSSGRRYAFVL